MTTTDATSEQKPPPYLAVARLEKMFNILSAKTPDSISPVFFKSNGFSQIDALLAINTLKFLGLLDSENRPTEDMAVLRIKGEKRAEGIRRIVEKAYKPLFDNVDAPHDLDKDGLFNAFSANYPKFSDRVYRTAIPIFLKLSEYAGLKAEGSVRGGWEVKGRAKQNKVHNQAEKPKKPAPSSNLSFSVQDVPSGFHAHSLAEGKISILISEEWNTNTLLNDDLFELWRSTLKAAAAYAKKYKEVYKDSSEIQKAPE